MIRCRCEESADWAVGKRVELVPEESNHLCSVLRAALGEPLELMDGRGGVAQAVLEEGHKKHARVRVTSVARMPAPMPRRILAQAVIREQRMDWLVQKAVELGVGEIWPLQTEYAVVRIRPEEAAKKSQRWQAVAWSACKQSGNPWLPRLEPVQSLASALARMTEGKMEACFGGLQGDAVPLPDYLGRLHKANCGELAVLIGPEGDFSLAEVKALHAAGVAPVSFGPLVFRVETASLFALSAIQYVWLSSVESVAPVSSLGKEISHE